MKALPISGVLPTRHRPSVLTRTLASLFKQSLVPAELIVVDGSDDVASRAVVEAFRIQVAGVCNIRWMQADTLGAAAQRNQGIAVATHAVLFFLDDDILFEPECMARLWTSFNSNSNIGGASAMITNQRYNTPGWISRTVFTVVGGKGPDFAGRVFGPAVNLLPDDREDLPEIVPVDWLNLGCTLYRRDALPDPPFSSHFTGYSLMEDLTLSLVVSRNWKLVNARTARIYHDSQLGSHKENIADLVAMELINRHYVMTQIMGQHSRNDYLKLIFWQKFSLVSSLSRIGGWIHLPDQLRGRWRGWRKIMAGCNPS